MAISRETSERRARRQRFFSIIPDAVKLAIARTLIPNLVTYITPGRELLERDYLGKFSVMIDPRFPVEARMFRSRWEPQTVAIIRALVTPGAVCLDIGANVGALTLAMADCVGAEGMVHAFEPGPFPYGRLVRNLGLNPAIAARVVPRQLGVADRAGTLYWSADEDGNPANATMLGTSGTAVEVIAIDEYVAAHVLTRIDFVKIDVESMEFEVLSGGAAAWRRCRPVIYFESERKSDAMRGFPTLPRIEALLRELGYSLFAVDAGLRLRSVTADTMDGCTLAVPSGNARLRDGATLGG